jgi:hypothetical protein
VFLIDALCLGIKDVMFESVEREALEAYLDATDAGAPLIPVDPSYARKLLCDLAKWSHSIGFAPHRDFAALEPVFGDVNAGVSDAVFRFGREGKPFYIPGPTDTPQLIQRRLAQVQKYLADHGPEYESAA